ncbi:hypothetical protein CK203_018176 [Vitis vinifera]|uniref:DUF4283 domain-containing protein n=1 Tax=Vitis vinifera TaxID=29760 RepID=A0A438JPJ7_VITVI|nr:hypothetical protein CK203_018176 [Vitis vinifera]
MEELQWTWLLVKCNGEELPNVVEVSVEELCYSLTLWREVRPVMRAATARKRRKFVATGEEVGGAACTCAGERVLEAKGGSRLEALLLHADGTWGQSSGSGQVMDPIRSFDGPPGGQQGSGGLTLLGLAKPSWCSKESEPIGLVSFSDPPCVNGPPISGLSSWKISERAKTLVHPVMSGLDNRGPSMPLAVVRAQDGLWRLSEEDIQSEGKSKTNCALLEEDARYENVPISIGLVETVKCWELIEVNNDSIEENKDELCLARSMPQEGRGWKEVSWEESDLARYNKFLGFSTEGLEKDILEVLLKIRKRRERVHSKTLLEKLRFERELKRLECSINYEGGKKKKCAVQGRGCQIMEVQ